MKSNDEEIRRLWQEGAIRDSLRTPVWLQASGRDRLKGIFGGKSSTKADVAGSAALTFGDLLYDAAAVDQRVIEATDFASRGSIDNVFSFAFKAGADLNAAASTVEGRIIRLRGYVGEQYAAQCLRHGGKEVCFPDGPTQSGYDLIVDGQPFQVKCADSLDSIRDHFEKYPDIPVIANLELADQADSLPEAMRANLHFEQGYSCAEVDEVTRASFDAGDEMLDFEVPWISLAMAGTRTFLRYRAGGTTLSNAVARCAAEWATRSALGTVGAPVGKLVGLMLFGPAGGVVLGGAGAVVGMSMGHKVMDLATEVIARGEKRAAADAVGRLLNAGADAIDDKMKAHTARRERTEAALERQSAPPEVWEMFAERLNRETRDQEQSRNELRHYRGNVDELGPTPVHWATKGFDLLKRAAVHPHFVQTETTSVLEMVDAYRKRLKNPLPKLETMLASIKSASDDAR